MSKKDALVKNASDPKQVKEAARKERDEREDQLNDIKVVLGLPEGRRLMWRLMEQCKAFASVWEPSAKIHYNAGQQDVGHFLMAEVLQADEEAFFIMMKEAKGN